MRFSGSNTLGAKLIPELAKGFLEQEYADKKPTVSIQDYPKNAEGEVVEREVKAILADKTAVSMNIKAHGSVTAFQEADKIKRVGLEKKFADIGMSSRKIKDDEVKLLQNLGKVDEVEPIQGSGGEHVIAMDGIAIIVSPLNLMEAEISLEDLRKIYSGEITRWEELPGANNMTGVIHPIRRNNLSGTYEFFCEKVMNAKGKKGAYDNTPEPLSAAREAYADSDALKSKVIKDRQAIGFVGLAHVNGSRVLAIKELRNDPSNQSIPPDVVSVKNHEYPLARKLYLYTANPPSETARKFIVFALSKEGQQIIAQKAGAIPIYNTIDEKPPLQSPAITSTTSVNIKAGTFFEFQLTASPKADLFRVIGNLPDDLVLDNNSGMITGSPRTEGEYKIKLQAHNTMGWGKITHVTLTIGPEPHHYVLRLHGSNSIGHKLAVDLAKQFMVIHKISDPVIEKGPENEFEEGKAQDIYVVGDIDKDGRKDTIEIKPHGSSIAFVSLREGLCEIGLSSRRIKPVEYGTEKSSSRQSLEDILGYLPFIPGKATVPSETVFGYDGIAVMVNNRNRTEEISFRELEDIYTGKITSWKQLAAPNKGKGPIHVYARSPLSGTYQFFKDNVFPNGELTRGAKNNFEDGKELAKAVAEDPNAIGFLSLPDAQGVKILKVKNGDAQALEPDVSTIRSGAYALTRPLYLYLPIAVAKSGNVTQASLNLANDFKEMVLSPSGQKIVEDDGFVPVAITAHPCEGTISRWKIPHNIEFDTAQDEIDLRTKETIPKFLANFSLVSG